MKVGLVGVRFSFHWLSEGDRLTIVHEECVCLVVFDNFFNTVEVFQTHAVSTCRLRINVEMLHAASKTKSLKYFLDTVRSFRYNAIIMISFILWIPIAGVWQVSSENLWLPQITTCDIFTSHQIHNILILVLFTIFLFTWQFSWIIGSL